MLHAHQMGMKRLAVKGSERGTCSHVKQGRLGPKAGPIEAVPQ